MGPSLHRGNGIANIESSFQTGGAATAIEGNDLVNNAVSRFDAGNSPSYLFYRAYDLMSGYHLVWRALNILFIGQPLVNITSAHTAVFDFYQYIVRRKTVFSYLGDGHLFESNVSVRKRN
jgi:hypothetical protein